MEDELSALQAIYPEQVRLGDAGFEFAGQDFSLAFFFASGGLQKVCVRSSRFTRAELEEVQAQLTAFQRELPGGESVCFRIITWATEYFGERVSASMRGAESGAGARAGPGAGATETQAAPLVEVAHCVLDHIRSLRVYSAALEEICASNSVACHVLLFTPHPTLVFAGEPTRVSAALRDMKTRNVDVNSRGQPCKERLLRVHSRASMPLSELRARGSNAGELDAALTPTCAIHQDAPLPQAAALFVAAGLSITGSVGSTVKRAS